MSQTMPAPPVTDARVGKIAERAQRNRSRLGASSPWYYLGIAVIVI